MSQNPVKKVLRDRIKALLNGMTKEEREIQSAFIAQKVRKECVARIFLHLRRFNYKNNFYLFRFSISLRINMPNE